MSENENFKAKRREDGLTAMTTTDTIDLNDDAVFAREVVAFVRNEPNKTWLGTVAEEQAEIAQRLARKDPSILEDADRLISTITSMHYVERGHEAQVQEWAGFAKRNDDEFYADVCNYVAGKPHDIPAGSVGEGWAKDAKRHAAEDPSIMHDQKRLLASVRGYEQQPEPQTPPEDWRIWNGRVNRACISDTEFRHRNAKRKAAAEAIDIATAEFHWWYGRNCDPYDDMLPLIDAHLQIGREYFFRAPGSDVLVNLGDLPEEKLEAAWKRIEGDPNAIIRIGVDAKGKLVATGFA